MYSLRFVAYLIPIFLVSIVSNFVYNTTTKPKDSFSKSQRSQTEYREAQALAVHFLQTPHPVVKFPKETYPEVKFAEITSPQIQVQENKYLTIITMPSDILFDNKTDNIRSDANKVLHQVSQFIKNRYPDTWLQILGHTDSKGSEESNLKLSEQWVAAVQQWLSQKGGVDVSLMTKQGYGETQPIVSHKTSDCFQNLSELKKNRRIEIVIQKFS